LAEKFAEDPAGGIADGKAKQEQRRHGIQRAGQREADLAGLYQTSGVEKDPLVGWPNAAISC
jgi:hypothetical protein